MTRKYYIEKLEPSYDGIHPHKTVRLPSFYNSKREALQEKQRLTRKKKIDETYYIGFFLS